MAEPNAGPDGMAILVLIATPPREPLRDGLGEGAYEGFNLIL
jgi:hypothetical protein